MRSEAKSERKSEAESTARPTRQDSWVDALVTLLATVVFGLGWALVELERADPALSRYDAVASEMWVAAVASSIETRAIDARAGDENAKWIVPARPNSKR